MFETIPFSPPLLILCGAFIGMAVGSVTGLVASFLLKLEIRLRPIVVDGILGAIGFPLAVGAVLIIPWRNTITYHVGDALVTSVKDHYQNPILVAYIVALVLPIAHELFRARKSAKSSAKSRRSE